MHPNFTLIKHGLATHKLTLMRSIDTTPSRFRRLVRQTSWILGSEMTRDLDVHPVTIKSAAGESVPGRLRDQGDLVVMPILRAGLTMAESFAELLPMARTAQIGIMRTPKGDRRCYMMSLPRVREGAKYIVLDTTLSQGETLKLAVYQLRALGIPGNHIRCGCLLVSKPGVENFYSVPENKDVGLFAFDIDDELDATGRITPGIGNASARLFRTNEDSPEEEVFE